MPRKSRKQTRQRTLRSQLNYANGNEIFNTFEELKRAVSDWCSNRDKDALIARYGYITHWHISTNITSLKGLFSHRYNFDEDLSGWNVSHVENMKHMFVRCETFTGRGLNNWNVRSLKDATGMFDGCYELNCDLSQWNVRNLEKCAIIFRGCRNFDRMHSCLPWLDKNPDLVVDLFTPQERRTIFKDFNLLAPVSHVAPEALSSLVFDMDEFRSFRGPDYGGRRRSALYGDHKGLRKTLKNRR